MTVKALMPVRNLNLVVPLGHEPRLLDAGNAGGYIRATSKEGGIGVPMHRCSASRSHSAVPAASLSVPPVLAARMGGRKARRFAQAVPGTPTRSSCRPQLALGAAVLANRTARRPHMANAPARPKRRAKHHAEDRVHAMAQHDFEAVFTKAQISQTEADYNESWGVKRRIALLCLTQSKTDMVLNFGNSGMAPDELMDMVEQVRDFRDHLCNSIELADAAISRLLIVCGTLLSATTEGKR